MQNHRIDMNFSKLDAAGTRVEKSGVVGRQSFESTSEFLT